MIGYEKIVKSLILMENLFKDISSVSGLIWR